MSAETPKPLTLLEKAMAASSMPKHEYSFEHMELLLAVLNGNVTIPQAANALGKHPTHNVAGAAYALLILCREMIRSGHLKIEVIK